MNISGESNPLHLRPLDMERPRPTAGATAPATPRTTLEVSPQGQEALDVSRKVREAPDIRTDRVEALRSRVEAGQYRVDLERLAEHLARIL